MILLLFLVSPHLAPVREIWSGEKCGLRVSSFRHAAFRGEDGRSRSPFSGGFDHDGFFPGELLEHRVHRCLGNVVGVV